MTRTIAFGTKAETLEKLSGVIRSATVLPIFRFTCARWTGGRQDVLDRLAETSWGDDRLIIRSSARHEDSLTESHAGEFMSVLDVTTVDAAAQAINDVLRSYGDSAPDDEVLIQPMLTDVVLSGVAFSRDPDSGAPYYIVNYETDGGTTGVSGGTGTNIKTFYHFKGAATQPPAPMDRIIALVAEIEALTGNDAVDVEFAVDGADTLILLQARPLVRLAQPALSREEHETVLRRIENRITQLSKSKPFLKGNRTVFGVMPDWNPAEMIGLKPKALALSLYKDLITDSIWAYQRSNYGYRNLRSFPLLISFGGLPYIDVRVTFNSFIPASLSDELAEKLVNYYIERLAREPALHDKVEFEILLTCFTLDMKDQIAELRHNGFSAGECEEIAASLRNVTNGIINEKTGLCQSDLQKIDTLIAHHEEILATELDPVEKIYWLLEDCKRYGTLPFAGLARAGFVAVQMLESLVSVDILTRNNADAFMQNVDTIGAQILSDFKEMGQDTFLDRYGHLRPGTYDITSKRYDAAFDVYFSKGSKDRGTQQGDAAKDDFTLSFDQIRAIETTLKENNLDLHALGLLNFIQTAIQGREWAKYVFSKNVSDTLSIIESVAATYGFLPEDCAHIDILALKEMYSRDFDLEAFLTETITRNKKRYETTRQLMLPPIIIRPEDVWSFFMPEMIPNFVTDGVAEGPVSEVGMGETDLAGKIVFVENADPGYDWLFSRNIAGFVSAFGGRNSHMAIRAGELRIPAVIGCGLMAYNRWRKMTRLKIDCAAKQVQEIF